MQRFKQFIDTFPFVASRYAIIPFPIHFAYQDLESGMVGDSLSEEREHDIREIKAISDKLHAATASNLPDSAKKAITAYTSSSRNLNNKLIAGHHPFHEMDVHNEIIKHSKPSGHSVHLYSGTKNVDFSELAKQSKDGILHSPAHISATHHFGVASDFSNGAHMIKVHVKPTDKILHVSKHSSFGEGEHETILPAGTSLKYSHTEEYNDRNRSQPMKIHHFEIHSQEKSKPVRKPTERQINKAVDSTDFTVATSALKMDHVKPHHLMKAINHPNENVAEFAAQHPKLPEQGMDHAINGPDHIKDALSYNPSLKARHIDKLIDHHLSKGYSSAGLRAVTKAKEFNSKHANKMVASGDSNAIRAVAGTKHFTDKHMDNVLKSSDGSLARTVMNAYDGIKQHHIEKAMKHPDSNVSDAAFHHPKMSEKTITKVLKSPEYDDVAKASVINRDDVKPHHLTTALKGESGYVARQAIRHPDADISHLKLAMKHPDPSVQRAATLHRHYHMFQQGNIK